MVKDAFQERAKAVNGFSKLRKVGAAKKFALSSSSDDFDDDHFSEQEWSDTEETVWQKPTGILEDLSTFLVNKSGDKRPRKQTIRITPEQFHKPRPIVVESKKNIEEENHRIPSELFNLLEELETVEEADEAERQLDRYHLKHIANLPWLRHCSQALSYFLPKRQVQYVLLHNDSFSFVCPASWSRAYSATSPPTMMLEHKEQDLTLMVAEVGKRHYVSVCSVTLINDSSSGARVSLNLPKHRLLTLSNLCHEASGVEASLRQKKAPLTTQVAQLEAREVHYGDSSWCMVDHQEEPCEMVDIEANNSFRPLSNSLCGICLERTHIPLALAGCGHSFCHQCWSRYLVASVSAGASLPIRCPESCCSQAVDLVTAAFILTRHQSNIPSWQTLLELSIKALPLYSCHRYHRPSYLSDRTHCPCGELRCFGCGLRRHWPASCTDFALSIQLANEDLSTRRLEVLVRSCPRCHECWEKTYGCNHMVCTLCKTSFCWGCGKEGSHRGGYCAHMESPLETKVVYTSGLFGLSSERLDAIEVGLKKVNQPTWSGIPQARRVLREVVGRCQPELSFKHTRRGNNSLHLRPYFAKVEDVVEKALVTFSRGSQFSQFGYLLKVSELQEVQLRLRRLEGDLQQVEQLLQVDVCNPRSVSSWMASLASVTARIEHKMATI
jgi:hypothetical protein